MIGLSIGLARSLTFFLYEKQDKNAPIFWSFFFSVLTIASYFIVNVWILQNAQLADLLCMVSLVMYAFIFRIRSLKIVRFTMLAPTTMAIAYNVLVSAALFATLTYVFELCVNLIAIARFHALPYFAEKHKRQESVLNEEELKQGEI